MGSYWKLRMKKIAAYTISKKKSCHYRAKVLILCYIYFSSCCCCYSFGHTFPSGRYFSNDFLSLSLNNRLWVKSRFSALNTFSNQLVTVAFKHAHRLFLINLRDVQKFVDISTFPSACFALQSHASDNESVVQNVQGIRNLLGWYVVRFFFFFYCTRKEIAAWKGRYFCNLIHKHCFVN